jgi:hypothetical protein
MVYHDETYFVVVDPLRQPPRVQVGQTSSRNVTLVLLVISLSGAQSVSMVSPSICRPPLMKLGEYLARQLS